MGSSLTRVLSTVAETVPLTTCGLGMVVSVIVTITVQYTYVSLGPSVIFSLDACKSLESGSDATYHMLQGKALGNLSDTY